MIEILQNGVHDTAVLWTGSDAAVLAPPYWCIVLIAADRLCADHDHFSISVFDELLNIPIETVFEHYFTDSVLFRDFVASLKMSGKLYWPKWSCCVLLLLYLLHLMLVGVGPLFEGPLFWRLGLGLGLGFVVIIPKLS